MAIYPQLIIDALRKVRYPGNNKDIVTNEMLEDDIRIEGNKVSFSLILKANDPFAKSLVKAAEQAILTYVGEDIDIKGNISIKALPAPNPMLNPRSLTHIKHKIAISSAKGGVGKSTVSSNLAVALANKGYKVGLLDADIYGPSIPKMFDIEEERPTVEVIDGKDWIVPVEKMGIKILSIAFFIEKDNAIIWRGAMASNALKQLINDTLWGDLDFFLIDLPPGTGDVHLTLLQTIDLNGAIIVSTPQQVALLDTVKGINMFLNEKINIPIVGLIENMSWFTPAELPNNKYYIFGKEGMKNLAENMKLPFLGQIPIVQSICESGDSGSPIIINENSIVGTSFDTITENILRNLKK
ncbi:MAG: Mrp/NBP35 family ATP-binding protein [Bacteroidales bacterium]|jgi:ATP-binding protein involved in chromosome partitioning|nr:Mrp/NBP35 family ATP-binding protein [Paludibacteraceae bacterium]MBP9647789.1 Mrp/NBP35 family ATP-binding protein [Paludibacteraceae bacterium]MBP9970059.1 Mrp/NBP35 family ATP-binding protein [Paludibacteraceae bacterium]NLK92217.1 Mrp/NBP35 family ATP-binding protein [Bacteroidales bacterium]